MKGRRFASVLAMFLVLSTAMFAVSAAATAGPTGDAESSDTGERICVTVSTDPPGASVAMECSGSGTVIVDGDPVI